ncbi:N-acetyltransferase [Vibrio rotiferianus]|uniref:N-acetyltransferase n=1 Tax=Vibrio rotiferianus TaxID=190895 RepID=A0A7Y3Z7V5_9VIBR|nr:GNAT family N-acetyltransferase [Vibrio rotiferianus]NOH47887.1 N-acetyltransferase [Vibrio rotiferianus]
MHKVTHDTENSTFWVDLVKDHKAKVVYELKAKEMHITFTLVPEVLRGQGYGNVMMEAILPKIEELGYRVVPVCPYVIKYMATHPQWVHLLV